MTDYLTTAVIVIGVIALAALAVAIVTAIDITSDRKASIRADRINGTHIHELRSWLHRHDREIRMLAATHPDPVTQRLVSQRHWEQATIGERPALRVAMGAQTRPVPDAQD